GRQGVPLRRRQDLAAVGPTSRADRAVRGARLGESILDIRAQRVQGQASLQIPRGARDFVAVQASARAALDSLATEAQRRINRLTHGAPETYSLLQLQCDRLRYQLRIELRLV